jgi:hypothetical protein
METQREIESAICDGMVIFAQEFMGRGPTHVRAHLLGDLLGLRISRRGRVHRARDRQRYEDFAKPP